MKKLCITTMLMALALGAYAQKAETPKPARQGPGAGRKTPQMQAAMLKEFDKNGDGILDEEERKAMLEARKERMEKMRAERLKEFDKNGDGILDEEERKAMREAFQKRRQQTEEGPEFQELLKKYDKNGDGKLDDDERKAMREAMRQERRPRAMAPRAAPKAAPRAAKEQK